MKIGLEGEPLTDSMVSHFDACLGCMACLTSCPSGVQYDKLIEATHAQVERNHRRSPGDRLLRKAIFTLFPYPRRLRLLRGPLAAYQRSGLARLLRRSGWLSRLPPTLRVLESLTPPIRRAPKLPGQVRAQGQRRAVVGMLTGCVQGAFFPDVNAATARVLAAEGCDVVIPQGQRCCGALSEHVGREDEALRFARSAIDTFTAVGVDTVVVNAAGCGSVMKEYEHLLRDDPATWTDPALRRALAARDIGEVFRLLTATGVAQRRIAELTGMGQSEVSEVLAGRRVMAYDVLARIADGFGVPRGLMGLAYDEETART